MSGYKKDSLFDNGTAWTEAGLHTLGKKIVAWACTTEHYTLTGYAIDNDDISIGNIRTLRDRHPIFKEYVYEAQRILAAKMSDQSFNGKASPYILKTFIPMYDNEVDSWERGRVDYEHESREFAKERHGTQDKGQTIIVETRGGMRPKEGGEGADVVFDVDVIKASEK